MSAASSQWPWNSQMGFMVRATIFWEIVAVVIPVCATAGFIAVIVCILCCFVGGNEDDSDNEHQSKNQLNNSKEGKYRPLQKKTMEIVAVPVIQPGHTREEFEIHDGKAVPVDTSKHKPKESTKSFQSKETPGTKPNQIAIYINNDEGAATGGNASYRVKKNDDDSVTIDKVTRPSAPPTTSLMKNPLVKQTKPEKDESMYDDLDDKQALLRSSIQELEKILDKNKDAKPPDYSG